MDNPVQTPQVPQVQSVLKAFNKSSMPSNKVAMLAVIGVVIVALGVGGGFMLSKGRVIGTSDVAPGAKTITKEAGIVDEKTFKDTATGVLKSGGIKGEGTHHLERDGGISQNVYLTSTVIDLESFVDKKVQVWGQTIAGKEAGWLMDVGKVKVVE